MRKTTLVSGSSKNSKLPWAPAIKEWGNVIISPEGSERFCTNVYLHKILQHRSLMWVTLQWIPHQKSQLMTVASWCQPIFWVVISFITAFAHPLLTAWADGCIVSISSAARAVAAWPGIVYAGVKGMFWLMIHLLPLVIHQS
jgi:hypothetical protein